MLRLLMPIYVGLLLWGGLPTGRAEMALLFASSVLIALDSLFILRVRGKAIMEGWV